MEGAWTFKPDDVSWHEYLRGYGEMRWRRPEHEAEYHKLNGLLEPLYAATRGNLLDKTSPKVVIATKTPWPVQQQGHPPWTFKLQCLLTGRLSRAIPYERYIEFGIFSQDVNDGGDFAKEPIEVVDRITPTLGRLEAKRQACRPIWEGPGLSWAERYEQYRRSDEWLDLRQRVLRRDGHRCQWTGKSSRPGDPLQVHHLTYDRIGCELLEDLITVCRSAHAAHHGKAA